MVGRSIPWTKAERARADRMAIVIGCVYCCLESGDSELQGRHGTSENRHHIISGNKRMGHWWTLPVCIRHHADCHNGTYKHAQQIDTWLKVQHALGLSDELPPTKVIPRRVA